MANNTNAQPILVPVDFSRHSKKALLKACELSECMKLPLIVLHVVHDPADMPGYYTRAAKKKLVRIEDLALQMFEDFIKALKKKYPDVKALKHLETMMVIGLPVTRILEVAEKVNADMIVMGSQGRTGLQHMMLGSKAEQIVRLAPIPVMIVKVDKAKEGDQ